MNGTLSRSLTKILYFLQDSKMDLPGVATLNMFLGLGETGQLIREGGWSPMLPTDPTQVKSWWSQVGVTHENYSTSRKSLKKRRVQTQRSICI